MSTPQPFHPNQRRWLPEGTVYGTLLNFNREFDLWAPKMTEAPYKAAAKAPVLYVKTANTFAPCGAEVPVQGEVEVGASVGLVIGRADEAVKGWPAPVVGAVLLSDLSLPHDSYYRPAIRFRNRDRFLVCGATPRTLATPADVAKLKLTLRVNDMDAQTVDLSTLVRDAATLLRDVGEFMTLQPGDVLMLGTDSLADGTRPRVKAGDRVEISAPGFEPLTHTMTKEAA